MAGFSSIKLTSNGMKLLTKALAGANLSFTEIIVGDGYLPEETDETQMTSLVSQVTANVGITGISSYNNGTVNLKARLVSGENSFFLREIGIMAQVDNETPVLYAYANAGDYPDFIPSRTEGSEVIQDINLITIIGQAENVTANVTVTAGVNSAEFSKHKTETVIDHPNGSITAAKLASDVYEIFDTKLEKCIVDGLPEAEKTVEPNEFTAVGRCTISTDTSTATVTTAANAGNKYALANLDFTGFSENADKVAVDFDIKMPQDSRWYVAFADLTKRPGTSSGSDYDKTGNTLYFGTAYKNMLYVNGEYKLGDTAFGVWLQINAVIDLKTKKVTYKFYDETSSTVLLSDTVGFADGDIENVTGMELYSWANECQIQIRNVRLKAYFDARDNVLYHVKTDNGYDTYTYIDNKAKLIAQSVPRIDLTNLINLKSINYNCWRKNRDWGFYGRIEGYIIENGNTRYAWVDGSVENGVMVYSFNSDGKLMRFEVYVDTIIDDGMGLVCGEWEIVKVTADDIDDDAMFSGDYNDLTNRPNIASVSAAGLMSANDKGKLDSIPGNVTTVEMTSYTESTSSGVVTLSIVCDEDIKQDVLKYYHLSDNCGIVSHLNESAGAVYSSCTLNGMELIDGEDEGIYLEGMFKKMTSTHVLHWNGIEWEQVNIDRIYANLEERVALLEERIASLEAAMTSTTEEGEV